MKLLEFKSIEPFFSQERDGEKPFTIRRRDKDSRFRALSQWKPEYKWAVRITNPATGESFTRLIHCVSFLPYFDFTIGAYYSKVKVFWDWRIIVFEKEER